ncbi:MAG: hypothetical protein PSX80_02415 [bacterium]|nr:hypothetical protein [bacterium]
MVRRFFPSGLVLIVSCLIFPSAAYSYDLFFPTVSIVETPRDGGIREEIPKKYLARYERWKAELLSTDFGRQQWEAYAHNNGFVLIIKMSGAKGKGAGTDNFEWDRQGSFVGATITLGDKIDNGYPNPIYYPVLNSLSADQSSYLISGRILAATKLSHELSHVAQAATASRELIEKQSKLIPEYTSIFLKNGHNTRDQKLVELEEEIGGTPIEIWESREYWSEVTAMKFLSERIKDESYYCFVFNKIRSNVTTYAREYVDRFEPAAIAPCGK